IGSPAGIEVIKESFPTTRAGLAKLASFLSEAGVTTVAMEATGVYWKPVYYALEGLVSELWLCNAQHVKNVPGRKTDLSDAQMVGRCCEPRDGETFNGASTRDSSA
ncbi:IS110 family transposase, partial [Ferrimicrobium acidiphilum]|uniref:IS110 family transposase n=1 Tax=Ferrimicrobium acidiphilum TaxID=121039 RepID=UPI003F78B2E8